MKLDHEIKAFGGYRHTDRSLSFGMASGKVNFSRGGVDVCRLR